MAGAPFARDDAEPDLQLGHAGECDSTRPPAESDWGPRGEDQERKGTRPWPVAQGKRRHRHPDGRVLKPGLVRYREPIVGKLYLIGADVGEGLSTSDWSSPTVIERDGGEQVAQLRGRWTPDVYAAKLDALARYYGTRADPSLRTPVIVGVERNNRGRGWRSRP